MQNDGSRPMLRWAASVAINRLFVLAAIVLAINTYARTTCGTGGSFVDPFEKAVSGLREIARAIQ
ncbi:MAG: hypothetical protein NVSMB26_08170 [Beijerinckiaceae bacterium]